MDQLKPYEKHKLDYGRLGLHEIHPTNNSVLVICKDYNDQSRGSTLHSSLGVYKLMQTLDIR